MRKLSNTISIKLRTVEAFKNQLGHVRTHRLAQKSRQVAVASAHLEESLHRLEGLISEVARLQIAARKGETVQKWRSALRNRSLRPLAAVAKAHLHLKLAAPHKEASNAAYIHAGEVFAKTLRRHLRALIANGMDDDCLDVLANSTAKLKQWTTQQSADAKRLREVGKQEKAEMARTRLLAQPLHAAMVALCEDNPLLLEPWNNARRIPKRLGYGREVGGHLKADRRRPRTYGLPQTKRPFDFDVPPEPASEP